MKQIVSIARNLSIGVHSIEDKKKDVKIVAFAEVIIAYTDGKTYSMNDSGELHKSTKVSEIRLHLSEKSCKETIEYLQGVEKELKAWREDES